MLLDNVERLAFDRRYAERATRCDYRNFRWMSVPFVSLASFDLVSDNADMLVFQNYFVQARRYNNRVDCCEIIRRRTLGGHKSSHQHNCFHCSANSEAQKLLPLPLRATSNPFFKFVRKAQGNVGIFR